MKNALLCKALLCRPHIRANIFLLSYVHGCVGTKKKTNENLMFGVLIVTCTFTSGPASSPQNMAFLTMPSRKLLTHPPPPQKKRKKKQTALRHKKNIYCECHNCQKYSFSRCRFDKTF